MFAGGGRLGQSRLSFLQFSFEHGQVGEDGCGLSERLSEALAGGVFEAQLLQQIFGQRHHSRCFGRGHLHAEAGQSGPLLFPSSEGVGRHAIAPFALFQRDDVLFPLVWFSIHVGLFLGRWRRQSLGLFGFSGGSGQWPSNHGAAAVVGVRKNRGSSWFFVCLADHHGAETIAAVKNVCCRWSFFHVTNNHRAIAG